MKPMLIGLHGNIGSGKSTAAWHLADEYGFQTHSYAKKIKQIAALLFGCHWLELDDQDFKASKVDGFEFTWRQVLQKIGTEFGRHLDDELWIKLLFRDLAHERQNIVISDVRFENEAQAIRDAGGYIVHIKTDAVCTDDHPSEKPLSFRDGDFFIGNDKRDLQSFYQKIDEVVAQIKEKHENPD